MRKATTLAILFACLTGALWATGCGPSSAETQQQGAAGGGDSAEEDAMTVQEGALDN